MNPVTGTGCTSVDIGDNTNLELVDTFCYLGDMNFPPHLFSARILPWET